MGGLLGRMIGLLAGVFLNVAAQQLASRRGLIPQLEWRELAVGTLYLFEYALPTLVMA